ncbi:MAG: hypothetical protein ABIZ04_09925 [Opitutus sp.]
MNAPTYRNGSSATKKITGWLSVLGLVLSAVVFVSILLGKEARIGELLPPLLLAVLSLILRRRAEKGTGLSDAARG